MRRKREPTIRLRRMGMELREIRHSLGLSMDEVAALTVRSGPSVSRWEHGYTRFFPRDLEQILNCYGVHDEAKRKWLHQLNHEGRRKGWWHEYGDIASFQLRDYVSLEAEATQICTFEFGLIPGMLQNEEYARTAIWSTPILLSNEVLERYLELRMNRQRVLTRKDPPELHAIIGEAALRQLMGGREVMRSQLEVLVDLAELDHITIQILPFTAHSYPAIGSFKLLHVDPGLVLSGADHPFGSVYTDEPHDVEQVTVAFERLRSIALTPKESRSLIESVAAEL